MLTAAQIQTRYTWPTADLGPANGWTLDAADGALWRELPEKREDVAEDSRWPAFFPSPICLVTTGDGETVGIEKVVGASIVNRFPYIVALSFCTEELSTRHYPRRRFCDLLESTGRAAVQFLAPGPNLDAVMGTIASIPDEAVDQRIAATGLVTRTAITSKAPVFDEAFMVYEAELVTAVEDYQGVRLFEQPWTDVGSHRIYYFKISTIQLREEIAAGENQIKWRSLPSFEPGGPIGATRALDRVERNAYTKTYRPNYSFPASGTIAFEADYFKDGMAVKEVRDALITDNEDARWPCFFPQSAGIITSRTVDGAENVMPCGSTTILSRHPLVVAPCISYADVNERYAPRASLDMILESGWFGCGVPFVNDQIVDAIVYAGSNSLRNDLAKLANSGLRVSAGQRVPVLADLPVFFECKVIGHQRLGTHVIVFGEVQRIRVRDDVSPDNALEWCPWADVADAD